MTQSNPQSLESTSPNSPPALARHMTLFALVVYGVGDMVGSGIYGTVGKVAGQMGNTVWIAFLVSMVAAMLTGMSYASIASRYPRAAGAAYVTHRAFHRPFLSYMIGLTVTASGLTSMATSTNVFSGILAEMLGLAKNLGRITLGGKLAIIDADVGVFIVAIGFLLFLTFVNFWGIRESMWTNLLCTAIEVGGLLFVVVVGARYWGSVNYFESAAHPSGETSLRPMTLFSSSVLAFFAFVGFEDMLNVAEEVKSPERNMPRGIVLALAAVTVLYIAISVTAVSVVPYAELAAAPAPLAAITGRAAPWLPAWVFRFITMFAVANTVLINYIMGSRLLYGMARQGLVPAGLGRVHAKRHTPHVAILTLLTIVIVLSACGGISDLGTATGLLLLTCFMIVNGALIVLKLRPGEPRGHFEVPILVPALGILVNGALIIARLSDSSMTRRAPIIAVAICVTIALMYWIIHPKQITEESLAQAEHDAEAQA